MLALPTRNDWLLNLCRAARVEDDARERLHHKPAVVAFQERVRDAIIMAFPHGSLVKLLLEHLTAPLTLAVCLVEGFELFTLWGKLIRIALDEFLVHLRVEFFEERHG